MRQRQRRRMLRRRDGDRGAVTVEIAGYTTLMLLTLLVGVQVVMWGMAALGAHYTANHAVQTTRVHGGTVAAGQADADAILTSAVGNALDDPQVTVTRTATTVTVTVRGTAISIIPGFRPSVTVTVQAPVERINYTMRAWSGSLASRLAARRRDDRGSVSVELAGFVLPAMLVTIVIVAAAFNLAISRLDLETASAAAARAASLQRSSAAAVTAARQAAEADLAGRAITCANLTVDTDTSRWGRGGSVTVTVQCTVSMATLARMSGIPGTFTATSTSTAPIDTFRQLATGFSGPDRSPAVSL